MPDNHPPRPGPARTERGGRASARLLAAAGAVLVETGGDLEVAAVANRAGVSVGLPYRYFGSRSGLLRAIVESFYDRLDAAVLRRAFAGSTWQERERARTAAWVEFLFHDPLAPIVLGRLARDGSVAAVEMHRLGHAIEAGARNIERGQADGDLPRGRDARLLAAAVLGGMRTSVVVALAWSPRPDLAVVTRELWAFVLGSVGSSAPEPAPARPSASRSRAGPRREPQQRRTEPPADNQVTGQPVFTEEF